MVGFCSISNPSEILWVYLLPARMKKIQSKMKELEWSQQGQLTPKSVMESCRNSNSSNLLWLVLLSARIKKNKSKMKEIEWSQDFPIISLWELSVAMEIRVLIPSYPKPNAINPPPKWCFWWNLIMIGQLVSEIFMFESVDARTDAGSSPIL